MWQVAALTSTTSPSSIHSFRGSTANKFRQNIRTVIAPSTSGRKRRRGCTAFIRWTPHCGVAFVLSVDYGNSINRR